MLTSEAWAYPSDIQLCGLQQVRQELIRATYNMVGSEQFWSFDITDTVANIVSNMQRLASFICIGK